MAKAKKRGGVRTSSKRKKQSAKPARKKRASPKKANVKSVAGRTKKPAAKKKTRRKTTARKASEQIIALSPETTMIGAIEERSSEPVAALLAEPAITEVGEEPAPDTVIITRYDAEVARTDTLEDSRNAQEREDYRPEAKPEAA